MINKRMLKAAITMAGMTQGDHATTLGISKPSLSYRKNGKVDFSVSEIQRLAEILSLTDAQKLLIFFADDVDK